MMAVQWIDWWFPESEGSGGVVGSANTVDDGIEAGVGKAPKDPAFIALPFRIKGTWSMGVSQHCQADRLRGQSPRVLKALMR